LFSHRPEQAVSMSLEAAKSVNFHGLNSAKTFRILIHPGNAVTKTEFANFADLPGINTQGERRDGTQSRRSAVFQSCAKLANSDVP
jgi:hypothetical protein